MLLSFSHKAKNKPGLAGQDKLKNPALGKAQKGDKPEKMERQQSRLGRGATPFHRRIGAPDDVIQCDSPLLMGATGPNTGNYGGAGMGGPLPQLNSTEGGGAAVESLSPADMSPLDEQQSQNQILDPSMPKLSPHPPVEASGDKDVNSANKPTTDTHQNSVISGAGGDFIKPADSSTPKGIDSVLSPLEGWGQQSEAKTASINSWIKSQQTQRDTQGIKRPALPTHDADQDELVIKSLYDFNSVKSWWVVMYPLVFSCSDVKKCQTEGFEWWKFIHTKLIFLLYIFIVLIGRIFKISQNYLHVQKIST